MQYPVLIEQKNGAYQATIPALADLRVEAPTAVEALQKAQQAAEEYLAQVTVATIEVPKQETSEPRRNSPQAFLQALEIFKGHEDAMREHFAEIAAEREREREERERLNAA